MPSLILLLLHTILLSDIDRFGDVPPRLTSCSIALLLLLRLVPVTSIGVSALVSSCILGLLMGLLKVLSPHLS
ncbi:hypothetical protein SLEP1_g35048 [Rubroshorea leprosula]|uniref:Uncharacterized protein n=1 Tax=Rubroshorea leprosula TaxID=152421 RepID=A0AAV5KMB7_9ROSI|nr:hypothetical protein SLEP1_g35048 [Rubroshorea leprosula]